MLATLTFAGLRIGELLDLRWRRVDLAGGWLALASKTAAGRRKVKIRGALRDELLALKTSSEPKPNAYVFPTSEGKRFGVENVRNRVLAKTLKRANDNLSEQGEAPLPKLTPHSLRRTFASLLYALGEPPTVVMAEMGHTTPGLLSLYAKVMRRGEAEQKALGALIEGQEFMSINVDEPSVAKAEGRKS
jgi:integrase